MASEIAFSNIVTTYPVPGRDNDSQGLRTNFSLIKDGLETAAAEISLLQANKADLVEQSVFTNTTPSFSTATGAVVVAGGVGIAGDVYIGGALSISGGDAISSSTSISSANLSDIIATGTFGEPTFTLASTIPGNKTWRGRQIFSPGTNQDPVNTTSTVFIATTGSTTSVQTGLHITLGAFNAANSSVLKLQMISSTPDSFVKFITGIGAGSQIGEIKVDSGKLLFSTTSGSKFTNGVEVSGSTFILSSPPAIASTSTTGITGQISWDDNYIYVCIGTNQWRRAALTAW